MTIEYIDMVWDILHDACKTFHIITVHSCLPEDEPSGSEHVVDIRKLKY